MTDTAPRLHLLAEDEADVRLLSALAQDAVLRHTEVCYDRTGRRLGLMLSRYCRECAPPRRVKSVLTISSVTAVRRRGWPEGEAGALTLLAIHIAPDAVQIDFSGGASLRAEIECIDLLLDDLGEAWLAKLCPQHPD